MRRQTFRGGLSEREGFAIILEEDPLFHSSAEERQQQRK